MNAATIDHLLASFGNDPTRRGAAFETATVTYLRNDPVWDFDAVWLWDDWDDRWGPDAGIDIVARRRNGDLWAIQTKCYATDRTTTKTDIDSFIAESGCDTFTGRLLITTSTGVSANALRCIRNSSLPTSVMCRDDIDAVAHLWPSTVGADTVRPEPKTLRPHQAAAVADVVAAFDAGARRTQAYMACGTGKTLTALGIAEAVNENLTVVMLPSLSLLAQTLREWNENTRRHISTLAVCSDSTVADTDDIDVAAAGLPAVTTNAATIAAHLTATDSRPTVVFSTYQSAAALSDGVRAAGRTVDLLIADEAHRAAGRVSDAFGVVLDDGALPAHRRVFMTATPRILTAAVTAAAAVEGVAVASMDNTDLFGPVTHDLTFRRAIELGLLVDYKVLVVGVDDADIADAITNRTLIDDPAGDAATLAAAVATAKAIVDHDLSQLVTFHSYKKRAHRFAAVLPDVYADIATDGTDLWAAPVTGNMSAGERTRLISTLRHLDGNTRGVLTNARCLTEGVDVPTLDGVVFVDPRTSQTDIVQAVGRAIRTAPGKTQGTIVVAVHVDSNTDPADALASSAFDAVWGVLRALRLHDAAFAAVLDELRFALATGDADLSVLDEHLIVDMPQRVDRTAFIDALYLRSVHATTDTFEEGLGHLSAYVAANGHALVPQAFHTTSGFALGSWINTRRGEYTTNHLGAERTRRLEALGMVWNVRDATFAARLADVVDFVAANGHGSIPSDYINADGDNVGDWARNIRSDNTAGELPQDRFEALDAAGFVWDTDEFRHIAWLAALDAFAERNGHPNVPPRHVTDDGQKLGKKICNVRRDYKTGRLKPEHAADYAARGLMLSPRRDKFTAALAIYVTWRAANSGAVRPRWDHVTADGFELGQWCTNVDGRVGRLSAVDHADLTAAGFWDTAA